MNRQKRFRTLVLIGCISAGIIGFPAWFSLSITRQHQLDTDLLTALSSGEVQEVRDLLKDGADPNARDLTNVKPESLLRQIMAFFTRSHSPEYNRAPTALSCATDVGKGYDVAKHAVLVKLLLDYGANVRLCEGSERPPLILAEEWADIETVRLLLEHGAETNVHLPDGTTALKMGIGSGDPAMVQLLLQHHAQVHVQPDTSGFNDVDEARVLARSNPNYAAQYTQIITILKNASKAN